MNPKDLRDIGLALALATLLCCGLMLSGCSGVESLGLFGGNSQVIHNIVYSPGAGQAGKQQPGLGPAASQPATAGAPVTITVNAHQVDGGLLGGNPSAALVPTPPATATPTTQPSTPVKQPPN